MAKPRLKDVADLVGVSTATVSRVVNDAPGVAAKTRSLVLEAVRELDYRGVGIRSTTTSAGLVGLLVPELTNPIFPAFAQELESILTRRGVTTILATARAGSTSEADHVDVLMGRGVDGLVVVSGTHADPAADRTHYDRLARAGVNVVLVNGMPVDPSWGRGWSGVSIDHAEATATAVHHLADLGQKHIGLAVGPAHHLPSREHLRGFRGAMEDRHLRPDLRCEAVSGVEGGHAAARELMAARATAIVCDSDLMALGVLRAASEVGCSVPSDLSVVGFDDAGPWRFTDPPLTSTRQPVTAMAQAVVRLLLDRRGEPARLWFRGDLIVRGSTGPAPRRT